MITKAKIRGGLAAVVAFGAMACADVPEASLTARAGTPELRAALFDTIMARVERRDAWSPIKNRNLGFDPIAEMRAVRDEVVAADTEEELFYAISKLSHARRDRHLEVSLVPGGLRVPDSAGLPVIDGEEVEPHVAPVKVFPDFSRDGAAYFVGDLASGAGGVDLPGIGDRVTAVNGVPIAEWEAEATKYMRHSTVMGLKWKLAETMTVATALFPPALRADALTLAVESAHGEARTYELPHLTPASLTWQDTAEPTYEGFATLHRTVTYDLLVDDDRRIVLLVWTGFRETMIEDVDALLEIAQDRGLLDYTMIVDVTRSGGGSRGAYATQRLQPEPFKTTFGNLRISDITEEFIAERRDAFARSQLTDGGVPETIDDGSWLIDWFDHDVEPALERDDAYTNDVPFKSAHAPRDSDGVLQPGPLHFRGPFAVISGPSGGSHLDQFVHQVVDNDLGPVVGMPPGGYSNTWEWEEVLTFPGIEQPVVHFMYDIGHTITPNGEIAEGNPPEIDEWIPLSAENVTGYYELLLESALRQLGR